MFVSRIDQRIQTAALKGRIDAHRGVMIGTREPCDLLTCCHLKRRIYG
jgi:hypothetical protein